MFFSLDSQVYDRGVKHFSSKLVLLILIVALSIVCAFLLQADTKSEGKLVVAFLDVGQGDAIYVRSPSGIDMLIDGGKDKSVLRELPKVMGLTDRTIDIVVATHPDADHIGGLPDVLDRYVVKNFVRTSLKGEGSYVERLDRYASDEKDMTIIQIDSVRSINLGGGAYAEILYPDHEIQGGDTNNASIVMRVVFGSTTVMLTGDAPSAVEEWLVKLYGKDLDSDILKAGHHGSKTSTSENFLEAVSPSAVVISSGKDNSYGHPHAEVMDRIQHVGSTIYRTDTQGTIIFESDGGEPSFVR